MTHWIRSLLLSGAAIVVAGTAAGVETWSYDTESCADDVEGKLYIRMPGGYEFAFPVDAPIQLGSPVEALQELPRDASEPEGCPSNPATMSGINLSWSASRYGDETIGPLKPTWAVGKLNLKAAARRYVPPPRIDAQLSDLEAFERRLQDLERIGGFHKVLFPGFEVVYGVPLSGSRDPTTGVNIFRASPGFYDEFDGRPFVGRCSARVLPGGSERCSLRYHLECGLYIYYTFSTRYILKEDLLDADRQIRHFIRGHSLADFPTEASPTCRDTRQ